MSKACCSVDLIGTNRIDRACHRFADRGSIGSVVLRPLDVGLHVARRHQTNGVAELRDFTRPMMTGCAGLHADQATGNLAKEVQDLLASQLTGDDNLARTINAVNLEYVLGEINADGVNLHVDDPLR